MEIIARHYAALPVARGILLAHSRAVADKALRVAERAGGGLDTRFIEEAALLHDIGILHTDAPMLGCRGTLPYICHGHVGRRMLEAEGLAAHALVCERHVGVGLSAGDIARQGFPIPAYDMLPMSAEEIIVAYADKFFSKDHPERENPLDAVRNTIRRYGGDKLAVFDMWVERFGP